MPLYVYECDACGRQHEEQRKIADRAKTTRCNAMLDPPSVCKGRLRLRIMPTGSTFPGADHWRTRQKAVR